MPLKKSILSICQLSSYPSLYNITEYIYRFFPSFFILSNLFSIPAVLFYLFMQGVHPSIKGVVWEFLLGCYDPNSTFEERNQLKEQRRCIFLLVYFLDLIYPTSKTKKEHAKTP